MSPATGDLKALAADLATSEAQVPGLRPGCEARVIWGQGEGALAETCLLYLHGFSASAEELRPLPDLVAEALGATICFARYTGHGQDGAALNAATFAAWEQDTERALDIAHRLGKRVIVMACSTGATLLTLALARGAQAEAALLVSPNFGIRNPAAKALTAMPFLDPVASVLLQSDQVMRHHHPGHEAYFTTRYPRTAVQPVADAVRAFSRVDLRGVKTPAFFAVNPQDKVIDPVTAQRAQQRWGGPTAWHPLRQTSQDDRNGHVMAGDIFSPGQTKPLAEAMLAWLAAR